MNLQNDKKRIVVKIGTSTLTHSTGKANIALIAKLASVLSDLKNEGHQIVLVSSGAISVGMSRLRLLKGQRKLSAFRLRRQWGRASLCFFMTDYFLNMM